MPFPAWLSPTTPATRLRNRPRPHAPEPAALEAFFDAYMERELTQQHIPGAVALVVQGGGVPFAKGYGVANLETGAAVDPAGTIFPVGSVSKLFTWTAIMQLVEQGRLDLDVDVNQYPDFRIPAAFDRPITLLYLMTHTAGFEERNFELHSTTPPAPADLGRWLKSHLPARVRPPGQFTAYSNYGTALAGYIVERVSGEAFPAYIENHILQPLAMHDSSFFQTWPEPLAGREVTGYWWSNGSYRAGAPDYTNLPPAGGLRTTAADMAHFMSAHLQGGRYGSAGILDEPTAQRMHERVFGHDPRVDGNAYRFWEMNQNGLRIIGHDGDVATAHILLALIPDQQVGLFISYNSTRSSQTTIEKLLNLVAPAALTTAPDGSLSFNALGGAPRYVQVEPLVYRAEQGDDQLVFRTDAQGRVTHLFRSSNPTVAYEATAWYEQQPLHVGLLAGGLLLVLSAVPAALIGFLGRRWRPAQAGGRLARRIMLGEAGALVIYFAGLAHVFTNQLASTLGEVTLARVVLILPLLMLLGAVAAAVLAIVAWRRHYWPAGQAVHYALTVAGLLVVLGDLNFWNAVGWRF